MWLSEYHSRLLNKKHTHNKQKNQSTPPKNHSTQTTHTPQQTSNLDSLDWLNVYGIIYYAGVFHSTYSKS